MFVFLFDEFLTVASWVSSTVLSITILSVPLLYWILGIMILSVFIGFLASFIPARVSVSDAVRRVRDREDD